MTDRSVKSAERTLALFELFSATEMPLRVNEISAALEIPHSSAVMLLRSLRTLGYLDYDRKARTYRPTIRILLLSLWVSRRFSDTSKIVQALDSLHRETGATAHLWIQNNARVNCVLMRGVDWPGLQFAIPKHASQDNIMIRSGLYRSITCTAVGQALLALQDDAEVRSWVRRANAEAPSERFWVNETDFAELIRHTRMRDYAETHGQYAAGIGSLAIGMRSPLDSTMLAVGVAMPLEWMAEKKEEALLALWRFRASFAAQLNEDAMG